MTLTIPVGPDDHAQGPPDAPVTLVEYGDYQCPYCGRAYPIIKAIQARLGDDLRFVFRNMPLRNAHPYAQIAAESAEAAAAQGRFWEMHDAIYEQQKMLSPSYLVELAGRLGLDVARVEADLAAGRYRERIERDFMGGVRSGVNGTPTFFVNGRRFDESWDEETLAAALLRARSAASHHRQAAR